MPTWKKTSLCLGLCLALTACSDTAQKIAAHRLWLKEMQQRHPRPIAPLPEIQPLKLLTLAKLPTHLFVTHKERQQMGLCVPPAQFDFPERLSDVPIAKLSLVALQHNASQFAAVIWDGRALHLVRQNALLGRERWQVFAVEGEGGVVLLKLDGCSRVVGRVVF